ncbi:FadR/GntR family transcriptional regulator [Mycolicibacterium celeriflavum]|uniref:GntR family transcriptional regulator n=1 Tax=Mycolicibacterium celeriflavum TaxID=1249101 RepID=A0A1X0BP24_MYCCF|nr:FadR/GntR family transcriptional regulator [Mycolicibacterium celeriflavum]MCV7240272.1 FadR family transcriptional regulator [Mycolicibacterium celeriflavum]ORA44389.1 GntR family transcriptional regulator [Mycolicibacterium celeriflavum]BBY44383.1 GntR family transcriptional regulator [Mycolicibacterium celeriflavum]
MTLATTRRTGLVDQAIEQLRASVASGAWPVNSRIPTEPELAAALGVGRNTVREAVRALAHSGLLEVRQGDGTYVRATSEVSGALRRLCGTELREVLQVRPCLEVEGARLAARARTSADLDDLRALLKRRDQIAPSDDPEAFARADTEFHVAVVRSSHNVVLIELYRGLTEVVMASVATAADEPATAVMDHSRLVEAIAAGDVESAALEAGGFIDEILSEFELSDETST